MRGRLKAFFNFRAFATRVLALCLCLPCLAFDASAAGYGVREFSPLAMGSSYAGASARNDDPSFLAYNPASVAGVGDWDATAGVVAVLPTSDATYTTARTVFGQQISGARTQDGFVQPAYVPDMEVRYRLAPEWSVGLAVTAPWGLSTTYDRNWAGRYHAHETKLLTVNIAPTVAYQISNELSVAASFHAQYATGRLSNAIDIGSIGAAFSIAGSDPGNQDGYGAFDAQDWGFGYALGVLWSPSEDLRIGASYRSQIEHRLTGPVAFSIGSSAVGQALAGSGLLQDTRGATDLTTPSAASVGAVFDVSPNWQLAGEIGFTDWSVFQELRVQFANPVQPDEVTLFRWKDSWFGAIGATYRPAQDWSISAGAAYDQSPAGAARNARIPDADRLWLSVGAQVALSEHTGLSFSFAHLFVRDEPINLSASEPSNLFRGDLSGTTDAEANAVSIQLTFH